MKQLPRCKKSQEIELRKCAVDPWYWLTHWVFTVDTNDEDKPVKLFPGKIHLYTIYVYWMKYRFLLIPKSRQMTVTWIISALYLHNAMFMPHRLSFFQSKKEDDADENLERVNQMWEHLPVWMREWNPAHKVYCRIKFPRNKSRLIGIPSGPDHARQFQPSGYFLDEAVYVDEVAAVVRALKPAIKGGGRFTAVSSAGPSHFGNMVLDKT